MIHLYLFANIQSLHKYFNLVIADKCFTSATFIFLVETWTLPKDNYEINNYNQIYRYDCQNSKIHAYGIMLYAKKEISSQIHVMYNSNEYNKNRHIAHNITAFSFKNYCFCVIYRSPSESFNNFQKVFQQMIHTITLKLKSDVKIIVVGDFDVDINNPNEKSFMNMFKNAGLSLKSPNNHASTNNNTQIDLCFGTNYFENLECKYYENYFGYRGAITVILNMPVIHQENSSNNINRVNTFAGSNLEISNNTNHVFTTNKKSSIISNFKKSKKKTSHQTHNNSDTIISSKRKNNNKNNDESVQKKLRRNKNTNKNNAHSGQVINGLSNTDCVSCYANSTIQCLLNSPKLIKFLKENCTVHTELTFSHLMLSYIDQQSHAPLTANPLRQYVGQKLHKFQKFMLPQQQDPAEFIDAISETHENCLEQRCFKTFWEITITTERICQTCGDKITHNEYTLNYLKQNLKNLIDENRNNVNSNNIIQFIT